MSTTLTQIRSKVRKVTGSPSINQLSDAAIDDYINTFYLYDMPEHLRLLKLEKVFTFYTEPNIAEYNFPDEAFVTIQPPIYVGGYEVRYMQSREIFFQRWPPLNQFQQIGSGSGTSNPALATITGTPIIRGTLYISAVSNGRTITYNDDEAGQFISERFDITNISNSNPAVVTCPNHPFVAGDTVAINEVIGMLGANQTVATVLATSPTTFDWNVDTTLFSTYTGKGIAQRTNAGSINYLTGAISMNWGVLIDAGTQIQAQWIFYTTGRPYDVLFYDTKFNFRPVPDKAYKVEINCFVQPTALINSGNIGNPAAPELREWWQLIAYGAALKVFADRADFESLRNFEALMEEQKILVQRRTLKQLTNQRTSTIYSGQNQFPSSSSYPYN